MRIEEVNISSSRKSRASDSTEAPLLPCGIPLPKTVTDFILPGGFPGTQLVSRPFYVKKEWFSFFSFGCGTERSPDHFNNAQYSDKETQGERTFDWLCPCWTTCVQIQYQVTIWSTCCGSFQRMLQGGYAARLLHLAFSRFGFLALFSQFISQVDIRFESSVSALLNMSRVLLRTWLVGCTYLHGVPPFKTVNPMSGTVCIQWRTSNQLCSDLGMYFSTFLTWSKILLVNCSAGCRCRYRCWICRGSNSYYQVCWTLNWMSSFGDLGLVGGKELLLG